MKIARKEFDLLRGQVYALCGLRISDGKEYLIEHRFSSLFTEYGCRSWMDFYELLCSGCPVFTEEVVSAISTHETSFFRDDLPFRIIRDMILPGLVRARERGRKIRIWCAACSTGQEPYSLAMLLHECCGSAGLKDVCPADFSILATDISGKVLESAAEGFFTEMEILRGLPQEFRKFFSPCQERWRLSSAVRSLVSFKRFNLLNRFDSLGRFDFVMCRNVLIYFDEQSKRDIVHRIHALLPENRYLMLGATETLAGIADRYDIERKGPVLLYRTTKIGHGSGIYTGLTNKKTSSAD